MLDANQIRVKLDNAIVGGESFSDFAEWLSLESASLTFDDKDLLDLVDSILNPLQCYFDGFIDRDALKNELAMINV